MLTPSSILGISVLYLGLLFAVATWADRRAEAGRSLIRSPYVYTLSLALYCSAWTFYGSVGLASRQGLAFLPVYLGPTLVALLYPFLMRKILRIAKAQGITSIADFIGARYGKSSLLSGLVAVVAFIAAIPYIALQLKAVAASVSALLPGTDGTLLASDGAGTALFVALLLAAFAILFGTRHIDATEQHEGLVVAVALESLVKLLAFLVVGVVVTWGLFDGFGDLLARHAASGGGPRLSLSGDGVGPADWALITLLSGLAFLVLPRQFQVAVIENVREDHVLTASWLLPLYLLVINLFVLPLALAGTLMNAGDGDLFVLGVPLAAGHEGLALVAYIGGLSAAAAMVVVASVALSTMISNDLLMPVLLRYERLGLRQRQDLSRLIIAIRRGAILLILVLGYVFSRLVGSHYGLANIGFIAFTGVAQFAPAILLGIYWRGASRLGALAGITAGVAVWLYTLVLPALASVGLIGASFVGQGAFGIELLRPHALLGLSGLDVTAHAVFWSLAVNLTLLVLVSLLSRQSSLEQVQAVCFVDVGQEQAQAELWRGEAQVEALRALLTRFLGPARCETVFATDARRRGYDLAPSATADAALVQLIERQLARAIGAASARIMVGSVVRGEVIGPGDLMQILDEASQLIEYSRRLEQKQAELEKATEELRVAYERLQQLDQLKDDFVATVSHELRTPLTSIRSFSEILLDTPDLAETERRQFLQIVVRETDRLTRLINDMLDLSKIESGRMDWRVDDHDLGQIVEDAVAATSGVMAERGIEVTLDLRPAHAVVHADRDRLVQVVVNLLSNAAKFVPDQGGRVLVQLLRQDGGFTLRVEDNGPGVPEAYREAAFEKFRQVGGGLKSKPKGTGLGLTISRTIIERFGGRIWLEGASLGGAAVCFTLPEAQTARAAA